MTRSTPRLFALAALAAVVGVGPAHAGDPEPDPAALEAIRARHAPAVEAIEGVAALETRSDATGLVVRVDDAAAEPRVRRALPPGLGQDLEAGPYAYTLAVRVAEVDAPARPLAAIRADWDGAVLRIPAVNGVGTGARGLVVYVEDPDRVRFVEAALPAGLLERLEAGGHGWELAKIGPIRPQAGLR